MCIRDSGLPALALPPELHTDLVFNAAAGIGGEPRLACGIKGIYRFHQPDGDVYKRQPHYIHTIEKGPIPKKS